MEPSEFLKVAESLAESDSEADRRTSIGRAYYCAYHSADWLDRALQNHGGIPENAGAHQQRSSKFKNYPVMHPPDGIDKDLAMKVRALGHLLAILHVQRTRADYKMEEVVAQPDVETALKHCRKILGCLEVIHTALQENYPEVIGKAG